MENRRLTGVTMGFRVPVRYPNAFYGQIAPGLPNVLIVLY